VDTLSYARPKGQRGARDGGKRLALAQTGNWKTNKKYTIEASMLLKKQGGIRNEAKKCMKTNGLLEISREEAEKLLKTNHMALLTAASLAVLSHKNTRI